MATTPFLGRRTYGLPTQEHSTAVLDRLRRVRAPGTVQTFALASYLSTLQAESDPASRLQRGVELLPVLVDGCDHASVVTVTDGRVLVRVAGDADSRRADELQDLLGEGPSLQAVRTGHSIVAQDLTGESRWPAWRRAVRAELSARSVLSVLLPTTQRPTAALNLYSDTVGGLSGVDLGLLHALAGPLAGALLDDRAAVDRLGPAA
jgi:hypothetical protein